MQVIRNDDLTVAEIEALHPTAVILSPGPGRPADAGVCEALIPALAGKCKMLGVCLGHQAICEAFGGRITYAKELMHGRECNMAATNLPDCLEVTATAPDGEIMAVQHKEYEIYGVQFHPESVMTPDGLQLIRNFLEG